MPYIKLNQIQFYYEITGEGEPVLLLHGLGSSTIDWENQVPALAANYQVISMDLRGHGKTDKPVQKYTIPLFTQDVIALLAHLNLKNINVVGLSMGGMIAFQLVVDRPDLVNSVVILNSGPEVKVRTWKDRKMVWQRQFFMKILGLKTFSKILAKRLFPEENQEALREKFYSRWIQNDKKAYYRAFMSFINWGVAEKIHTIQKPLLAIAAENDYTPVSIKEEYVKKIPGAKLVVIKNSRHATPSDQPEKLNEAILDFLGEVVKKQEIEH